MLCTCTGTRRPVGETGGSKTQGRGAGRGITRPAQGAQRRGRLGKPGPAAQLHPCAREGGPLRRAPSRRQHAHGVLGTRCASKDVGMLERSVCNTVRDTRKGALRNGRDFRLGAHQRVAPGPPQADSPILEILERNIVVERFGRLRRLDFLDLRFKGPKEPYRPLVLFRTYAPRARMETN